LFAACCGLCFVQHFCLWPVVLYIYWNYLFLITLQEKIDTVTVEGVENVEEEDCIKIKTEEHYIQLVWTVKSEQEVSVLCSCILW
jgi:cell division septal protein FtsQ